MTQIFIVKLRLSNAYLIKGRKTILVDTGAPREGRRILQGLAKLGIDPKNFSLILHTHAHRDHAGSTRELKRWVADVPTAVHEADAPMLISGNMGKVNPLRLESRLLWPFLNKPFAGIKPDILIKEEFSLKDYGVDGKVVFTPGHTPGSLAVVLNDGEAIVGDVLMGGVAGGYLFGRRPNYPYFAEDVDALRASVQKLLDLKVKRFHVGHGGPLDAKDVKTWLAANSKS